MKSSAHLIGGMARRKMAAGTRRLRGEQSETVARDLNVTAARLSEWLNCELAAAEAALRKRNRVERDKETACLKAKLGEITMANELPEKKIDLLEGKRPFAGRRTRR